MSIFTRSKAKSVRKFIDNSSKYVSWQSENDGDCRISIHDGRSVVTFHEWVHTGEPSTLAAFDKSMGILVDEINAFRKSVKETKGNK
jgi:hypothetical protein